MRMMRIGIDATALPSRPVGAGNYIIQLIRAIAGWTKISDPVTDSSQLTGLEFVIFVQRSRLELLNIEEIPNLHLVVLPNISPSMRLLWEQISFPKLVKNHHLDLLHSLHYTMPLAYPGRTVVTFHDMTFFLYPHHHTLPKRYFFRFFIRASSRQAVALIADSESTRQDAIRLVGVSPGKIFTVQLGVTQEFHPIRDNSILQQARQKYHLPEHFLLYVGMIEPRKNLPLLLQSFAAIAHQMPDYRLVIVGPKGWMVDNMLQQTEQLNISDKVHFTGYVEQADLPLIYNMADVFIYPSVYEGFGLPVLEAMACGIPVITSNVSSMPEIVGDAGVLFAPNDSQDLARSLLNLINNPMDRQRLSLMGLERAASFTWNSTAEKTIAVYRHVLGTI
jgi:glycosyltransferase involved in cell wall biosynthesis